MNDYDRQKIAAEEYTHYKKGEDLTFTNFKGKEQSIGTVVDVIDQPDNGLHMTVVRSQTFVLPCKISNSACFIV